LALESSSTPSNALVITDTNVKSNVATSILHIYIHNKPIVKTLHYTVNITSTETELFAIRCSINQATNLNNISKIIIVTNSIHTARKIFNSASHLFQKHSATILNKLQMFFSHHQKNSIEFWECPSQCRWSLHKAVDVEMKSFSPTLLFPSKSSWDFSKKNKCDDLVNRWKMTFQVSDMKGKHFLDLNDNNNNNIELSYIKRGS